MINDANGNGKDPNQKGMPLLVYVAREKRPSNLHHFKAGAINVLVKFPCFTLLGGHFLCYLFDVFFFGFD